MKRNQSKKAVYGKNNFHVTLRNSSEKRRNKSSALSELVSKAYRLAIYYISGVCVALLSSATKWKLLLVS